MVYKEPRVHCSNLHECVYTPLDPFWRCFWMLLFQRHFGGPLLTSEAEDESGKTIACHMIVLTNTKEIQKRDLIKQLPWIITNEEGQAWGGTVNRNFLQRKVILWLCTRVQTPLSLNSVLIPFPIAVAKHIAETVSWLKVDFGWWCQKDFSPWWLRRHRIRKCSVWQQRGQGLEDSSWIMDQEAESTGLEEVYKPVIMMKKASRKKREKPEVCHLCYLSVNHPQSAYLLGISLLAPQSQSPTHSDRLRPGKPFSNVLQPSKIEPLAGGHLLKNTILWRTCHF